MLLLKKCCVSRTYAVCWVTPNFWENALTAEKKHICSILIHNTCLYSNKIHVKQSLSYANKYIAKSIGQFQDFSSLRKKKKNLKSASKIEVFKRLWAWFRTAGIEVKSQLRPKTVAPKLAPASKPGLVWVKQPSGGTPSIDTFCLEIFSHSPAFFLKFSLTHQLFTIYFFVQSLLPFL